MRKKNVFIELMIYFPDNPPIGPYSFTIKAQRTYHLRFNELQAPQPIPQGKDYSSLITSNVPIVVQHSRLNSRQSENALSTTRAYAQ